MLQFLSNPFNDPNDPWYYVIGVLFLLLIFGALALYVIFSGKKKKQQEQAVDDKSENTDEIKQDSVDDSPNVTSDEQTEKEQTINADARPDDI